MPSEGGRRGRRDNGLDAAAFVPLLDVDPRVGEHLLDVLASAGVPAFLEPSADIEPYTRALSLPSPPTDRLWVDREQRREARQIVDAETPHGPRPRPRPRGRDDEPSHGLSDLDEERAWQEIVSAWEAGPARRGPADTGTATGASPAAREDEGPRRDGREDPAALGRPAPTGPAPTGPVPTGPVPTGPELDAAAEARARQEEAREQQHEDDEVRVEGLPSVDEGHYEPPPPPPVPRPSRQAVLAVLVIVLGVLLIGAPSLVGLDDHTGLTFGVVAVLGGGALLVLRLRETRGDDGPDDGAVV